MAEELLSVALLRASLVRHSRRYSRLLHEVEDLAHDIILSALRHGAALDDDRLLRTAQAASRQHAAFLARSAARRRTREAGSVGDAVVHADLLSAEDGAEGAPLSALSPALRTTLLLLVLGLDKAELCQALGVNDAALRKRFQALREHAPLARPALPIAARTPALSQLRCSQVELLPRLATAHTGDGRSPRVLAISDPDGHGLIFHELLTTQPSTATAYANDPTHTKGDPC